MPGFLAHVVEATLPVLKICLLGAVGAGMAHAGILDQAGRRTLSKLIYCLFTPALTFTKLAPVLSGQHLVLWMPLVINMFVSVAAGLVLGALVLLVVRPPAGLRKHVVVATALGNAGNLPLVLVAALIRETGGRLFGGEVMSEDLAIAYVAMGIWAATVTHFTIGTEMLKLTPAQLQQQGQQQQQQHQEHDRQALLGPDSTGDPSKLRDSSSGGQAAAAAATGSFDATSCFVELGRVQTLGPPQQQQQQQQQQQGSVAAVQRDWSSSSLRSSPGSADCLVLAVPAGVNSSSNSSSKGRVCTACRAESHPLALGAEAWVCPHCGTSNAAQHATADGLRQHNPEQGLISHQQQQQEQQDWQQGSIQVAPACMQEHLHLLGPAKGPSSSDATWQQQQQWQHQQQQQQDSQRYPHHGPNNSSSGSSGGAGGSVSRTRLRRIGCVAWDALRQLGSPPMVGCMLAVVVGLIRPVRDQLFAAQGKLLMIQDCISMFGDCCIPCLLLMLGATLSKGPGKACPPLRVVAGVAAARLVLMPLLGTAWLVAGKALGWYHAPDKMFILVMLIQNAVPTALNVHTLATLHSNKEAEMGAMLFWQYLAACVTLPAALSFFLWLLNTPLMSVA